MKFSFNVVPLVDIDFDDEWNLHPWELNDIPSSLKESLRNNKIIHPPMVLRISPNRYSVVHGFKRLLFYKKYIPDQDPVCLILAESTEPAAILKLLLIDQLSYSPLSLAEKGQFLKIAKRFVDIDYILKEFFPHLELPQKRSTFDEVINIHEQHREIVTAIHNGQLNEKTAPEIIRLPDPRDRLTMVRFFRQLMMGTGKQRKFFILLRDLASRENTTITEYLTDQLIQNILRQKKMNNPQKVRHLGKLLQNRLTPSLNCAEEDFQKFTQTLGLPGNCSLNHSKSFEKNGVTLSIFFDNTTDCENSWYKIRKFLT